MDTPVEAVAGQRDAEEEKDGDEDGHHSKRSDTQLPLTCEEHDSLCRLLELFQTLNPSQKLKAEL